MASGYYVVLALGAIATLGALIWPLTARGLNPCGSRPIGRRVDSEQATDASLSCAGSAALQSRSSFVLRLP